MISFLPKRLASLVSLVLIIGLLTPSAIKLAHAFHGHSKEKRCVSQGTNHIHDVDFDCDFQDFTTVSKVFFASVDFSSLEVITFDTPSTFYSFLSYQNKKEQLKLRGPPHVS
ncbi:hypothetical protein [Flagellimonas sp.]|uniref:hypothetical protein n=1 Tax=Flagellimonas sp. TaxID=2058762 RepID=UPI003B509224